MSKPGKGRRFNLQMLSLARWFPASKITHSSLELGLKPVAAFSLWATCLTTSGRLDLHGLGGSKCKQVLLKPLILAARCPFATFKAFGFASSSAQEKC